MTNQIELKPLVFPTPEQVQESLQKVEKLLEIKQLNMSKNFHVKEGLMDCVRILTNRLKNPKKRIFQTRNRKGS